MEIELNLPSRMAMGTLVRGICASVFYEYITKYPTSMIINLFLMDSSVKRYTYFEDVESWEEKSKYLLRMLDMDCDLKINHSVKYFRDPEVVRSKKNVISHKQFFDIFSLMSFKNVKDTKKNKVCFWRYNLDNLAYHRTDKLDKEVYGKENIYTQEEWYILYEYLNSKFELIELEYRTPIREVYYHIATSEFCVGYTGMYHNLATILKKPLISFINPKYIPDELLSRLAKKEYICLPTIEQITNDAYFSSLIDKARDALGGRINVY